MRAHNLTIVAGLVLLLTAGLTHATSLSRYAGPFVVVLGIAQDAGFPQLGCYLPHCEPGWRDPGRRRYATSLALVDFAPRATYLFEATPDIREQLRLLNDIAPRDEFPLAGVFLTHAHIGHYTGLMHFGHEAAGLRGLPVLVMPKMRAFLENNGPWSQLVDFGNVILTTLVADKPFTFKALDGDPVVSSERSFAVTPVLVPHRDEYSETVGFRIDGPRRSLLFIPDIDKWERWDRSLVDELRRVDYALLDGTFYAAGELPGRDMSQIPHPFVVETMALLGDAPAEERAKVCFIHFNHTNPLIAPDGAARKAVADAGFCAAQPGQVFRL